MNTENDTEQRQQQALHMTEPGADITEEQLQAMVSDEQLRADLQQMTDLRVAMQRAHDGCDVEQRLQQFHYNHPSPTTHHPSPVTHHPSPVTRHPSPITRYIAAAVAAAAVFAGIIYYVGLPAGEGKAPAAAATPTIFTADTQQQGISLTDEKGQQVTLSPATRQHTQLSLNDFRRVIGDTAHIEKVTLHVPYGKSADITLPDGTLCYLHPGSRVIFPTVFSSRRREVILDGEAYFKVAPHKGQPFVVHTPWGDVRDYGTEFNVNTRDPEAGVGVVLVNGKVGITPNGGSEVVIRPGQKCTFRARADQPADAAEQHCIISEADLTPYEMWRDGYLYFDNVALRDIMLAIGQNFNMTVEFRDTAALGLKMRFMAERNNGVEAALRMVNSMGKARATCSGRRIILEELKN